MESIEQRKVQPGFLGQGWSFPPAFDKDSGGAKLVAGREDIDQSLEILLSTSLGERVLQPNYGCELQDFVFSPVNNSFETFLSELVRTAILYFEPRIRLERVNVEKDQLLEGVLKISVDYIIRSNNSRFNFVFPFFINEGIGADVGNLRPLQAGNN
ncbi:MAG: GPW/gp25 family protein [Bacteroidota bacterium]